MTRNIIQQTIAAALTAVATLLIGACSPTSSAPNVARTEPAIDAVEAAASSPASGVDAQAQK